MDEAVPPDFYALGPANIACVITAAQRQRVPANVLLAIASVEGGKNGQWVRNSNGSFDLGHMQINTQHLPYLARFGIRAEDVAQRGCYNAELAAWMLRQRLVSPAPQDYWTKVANYHSHTPRHNQIYRSKIIRYAHSWGLWLQQHYPVTTVHKASILGSSVNAPYAVE